MFGLDGSRCIGGDSTGTLENGEKQKEQRERERMEGSGTIQIHCV